MQSPGAGLSLWGWYANAGVGWPFTGAGQGKGTPNSYVRAGSKRLTIAPTANVTQEPIRKYQVKATVV